MQFITGTYDPQLHGMDDADHYESGAARHCTVMIPNCMAWMMQTTTNPVRQDTAPFY